MQKEMSLQTGAFPQYQDVQCQVLHQTSDSRVSLHFDIEYPDSGSAFLPEKCVNPFQVMPSTSVIALVVQRKRKSEQQMADMLRNCSDGGNRSPYIGSRHLPSSCRDHNKCYHVYDFTVSSDDFE